MPTLTRWFIKTALIYLAAALLLGAGLALRPLGLALDWLGAFGPVYFHLFMFGWLTQLIFGVAHWMFPKASLEQPRGDERLMWGVYGLLNVGLLLRAVSEPFVAAHVAFGWLLAAAALLQWLAGLGAAWNLWGRVRVK